MQHKVQLTVLDKKLYPELQQMYCAQQDPIPGPCPCYHVGDVFMFERYGDTDHFWQGGLNTLVHTSGDPDTVAGGPKKPHCSELWDAVSRYIYTGLQGGSIMRGWMDDERTMIACCSDGTRPVVFEIRRIDYKAVHVEGLGGEDHRAELKDALHALGEVTGVRFPDGAVEVWLDRDLPDEDIRRVLEAHRCKVTAIE